MDRPITKESFDHHIAEHVRSENKKLREDFDAAMKRIDDLERKMAAVIVIRDEVD